MERLLSSLFVALILSLLGGAPGAWAARVGAVEVDLVARQDTFVPGEQSWVGLRIRHDPHWHTYWRYEGDSGLPTRLDLTLPPGWSAGEIVWPAPSRLNVGPLSNYGYEGEIVLPLPIQVPADARPGPVRLQGQARWLMCREVCIPGEAALSLELPVGPQTRPTADAPAFERSARASPAGALRAGAAVGSGSISLVFAGSGLSQAEFFPYRAGLIRASAPQRLYRLDPAGERWQLVLEAAEGAGLEERWAPQPVGVLVLDGRAVEVTTDAVARPDAGGTLVATATGSTVRTEEASAASRLLSDLTGSGAGAPTRASPDPAVALSTDGALAALLLAVAGGMVGGLLLNLMPCVFPVIGLKVLGFAAHADGDRRSARRAALIFGAGVLVAFWVLAGGLLALRAAGQAVGWGFQLQSPVFVAAIALLFVAMGLNFAGVFEIGLGMTRLGNVDHFAARGNRLAGAFGSGVLAVLVATPCSAPFMGSALGYTLGRSASELLIVFTAIAVGMAAPYVILGFNPGALKRLPRPGRWMESFRQFLAFPMFATVAWLLWVLGQQAGVDAVLAFALGAVLLAMALWMHGRFVQAPGASRRAVAAVLALLALAGGVWLALDAAARGAPAAPTPAGASAQESDAWSPWSEARVAAELSQGRTVFVDFTAAWCVTCQVNKQLVLLRDPVAGEFRRRGVVLLRADWTSQDPEITRTLATYGRNGVPLYLLLRPGGKSPVLLPEILTPGVVLSALDRTD